MGSQEERTPIIASSDSPMWDTSMQFLIKDVQEDTLCITVFDKGYYTPDGENTFLINFSHCPIYFYSNLMNNKIINTI